MSYLENSIDVWQFVSLQGFQDPPAQTKAVYDRPGVDGSEFLLTGTKGRPFTLISQADAESYQDAIDTFDAYKRLIDGDAVTVVQGGISSDSRGYRCVVMNVEAIDIRAIFGAVGNLLHSPSQGWIIARWDLVAVTI